MTWVKQNYDRFFLALFATGLIVCAGLLFNNARNFSSVFAGLSGQVQKNNNLPVKVNQEEVVQQQQKLATPDTWGVRTLNNQRLPLFVSVPYIENKGVLVDPLEIGGPPLHPPVPNAWFLDNKQDLLAPNALDIDSDGDGFTALDEWEGHTDPNDKNSHPPYYTKLFLGRLVRQPFRLRFDAKNGDTILINTIDVEDAATQFLKVGAVVANTKPVLKITKYEEKHKMDAGINRDVSEVTLTNTETGDTIVLPKQQEVDSPTTYAVLNYLWNNNKPFAVKKNQEFTLPPETKVKYKCLDLGDTDIKIVKEDENKELHIKAQPPARH